MVYSTLEIVDKLGLDEDDIAQQIHAYNILSSTKNGDEIGWTTDRYFSKHVPNSILFLSLVFH